MPYVKTADDLPLRRQAKRPCPPRRDRLCLKFLDFQGHSLGRKVAPLQPVHSMERFLAFFKCEEIQTTARLEARLPNDVHALLKRAAEIEGRTLTDFVVSAAREAACRTIEAAGIIRLSVEDQRQIAKALLNPPEPTRALKKAFRRRRELFGVE
jgi:uncharacterized protein (DUF1778 family)